MLFNSYFFIFVFLPLSLLGYHLLRKANLNAFGILWLTSLSLFFYGWWNPPYLLLMLASIVCNYALGKAIERYRRQGTQRAILTLGIIFNLGLIGYFKYSNFFVESINEAIGSSFNLEHVILPLAISFFTFQQIAYLVDVSREEDDNSRYSFLEYCLFVSFFPQLIAGPIVQHHDIIPQFREQRKLTDQEVQRNFEIGISIFSIGLFKKVVIADQAALLASPFFELAGNNSQIGLVPAWIGALAYTVQLYFDFSGYSDMAIGIARMFGIRLPINFYSPYKATSIADFWRRWHITLSHFLRDYLYIPLGGSRKGHWRTNANLLITMLLGGLWHGAGWTFVFWGGLHGLYLVIHRQWSYLVKERDEKNWVLQKGYGLITFISIVVAWVFFRAETMGAAFSMVKGMAGSNGLGVENIAPHLTVVEGLLVFLIPAAIVWLLPNTSQWMKDFQETPIFTKNARPLLLVRIWERLRWQPNRAWALFAVAACTTSVLLLSRESEFIYFQF